MKRAAIYARVSTHNGQNPEMQLEELRTYCQRREWQAAGEYVDTGISGAKEHRPALDRLLVDCRKRLVDAVVVYRYERFARSLRQLVNAREEFRALGLISSACTREWTLRPPTGGWCSASSLQLPSSSVN